jgi:hypothetical protein
MGEHVSVQSGFPIETSIISIKLPPKRTLMSLLQKFDSIHTSTNIKSLNSWTTITSFIHDIPLPRLGFGRQI